MNSFLDTLYEASHQFLPLVGIITLVVVIIFLTKLINLADAIAKTLEKTDTTIDLVDKSIEKIQDPLDAAVRVAGSVDRAYDISLKAISSAKDYVDKNAKNIKAKIDQMTVEENDNEEGEIEND